LARINTNKLRALRAEHGMNQEDIAELLNMAETTYNRKEKGHNEFSLSEAKKISEIFDRPIEDIFFSPVLPKRQINKAEQI